LVDGYPPPDCILCYSACEGTEPTVGSFFTTELCRSLQQFGQKLPFVEIITQVNRGTASVLGNVFELGQRPFYCSTLTRNLVLGGELSVCVCMSVCTCTTCVCVFGCLCSSILCVCI
jgi:hypothetical protein